MSPALDEGLRLSLSKIGQFRTTFEAKDFRFAEMGGGKADAKGIIQMPFMVLSEPSRALIKLCYDDGWVIPDFDWPSWNQSTEAQTFLHKPETIADATLNDLAKLLTTLIRQDRFAEGSLSEAYDTGVLTAILRRADVLACGDSSKN